MGVCAIGDGMALVACEDARPCAFVQSSPETVADAFSTFFTTDSPSGLAAISAFVQCSRMSIHMYAWRACVAV
jgi:hypothetical protein